MTVELPGGLGSSAAVAIAILLGLAVALRRELFWTPRRGISERDEDERVTALGTPPVVDEDEDEDEEYHGHLWWDPISALSDTRGCGWLLAELVLFLVLVPVAQARMPQSLHPVARDAMGFVAACVLTGLIGRTVYALVRLLSAARSGRR